MRGVVMQKIIFTYGIIAGLVIICSAIASIVLGVATLWLGYLVMIVAFSSIYMAIRQYRDQALGGVIKFSTAALLGLGIAAIASVVYVVVWEIYLYATNYAFIDDYASSMRDATKAEEFKSQYLNPLVRLPMTLLEVFPVGLLIALLSAALLRNNHKTLAAR
jgi:hypothetical protein